MRRIILCLLPLLAPACSTVSLPLAEPLRAWTYHTESVEKRTIQVEVIGEGDETVLFLAAIHGDETAGTALLERLIETVRSDAALLANRRVVIIPVMNPDGVAARTRRNANDVDLNRNFPARNYRETRTHGQRPLSEPESNLLRELVLTFKPERIISIHQPADRIDYDGPAAGLAYSLAALSPLEVKRLGARAGSLGSWAGTDLNIPVVTLELPRSADDLTPEERWEIHGALLLGALSY